MMNATKDQPCAPLVTVVIPTFNRPIYLEQALRSALAQTYGNIEVFVRDNGTDVETPLLIEKIADPRVNYFRHPQNVGMTNNVLGAFAEARGSYVTSLHDDDFWQPHFLEKMVAVLEENPTVSVAFCDHYIVDGNGLVEEVLTDKNTALFARDRLAPGVHQPFTDLALVQMGVPMAMASVVRRDAIEWDDFPNLTCAYDFWMVYLACRDGQACYYWPERLTSYRVHTASESTMGRVRLNQGFIEIYEGMLRDPRVSKYHNVFKKRLAVHHTETAIAYLRQGERSSARGTLQQGMKYCRDLKSRVAFAASYLPSLVSRNLPGKLRFPCLPTIAAILAVAAN